MTQLANYILDRAHGVENSHYKLAKLQKMEVHVVEFQEVVRAIVVNDENARKPQGKLHFRTDLFIDYQDADKISSQLFFYT